jgi:allophanate hydrolase
MRELPFTIAALRAAYASGALPRDVIAEVFRRIEAARDPGIFLQLADRQHCSDAAEALGAFDPGRPLWGIPFAVKDNIDVEGMPTTAACPAFAYSPAQDAHVVARLRAAGAIPIGKTNLDQFATGLVGTRTPYPVPRNALDAALVPGGSSSGSAVAVARGLVAFALGTDTAGSGRIPAALNNIVGLKPSLGALSTAGVVPACRTLDVVSILALTIEDAYAVFAEAAGPDPADAFSRAVPVAPLAPAPPASRIGVPDATSITFQGDTTQADAFARDLARLVAVGAEIVPLDFQIFYAVASLLYEGAWIAERHTVVQALMQQQPEAIHPVTRSVIGAAEGLSASDAFRGIYRLKELQRDARAVIDQVDLLCVPSAPTLFTLEDLRRDPMGPNSLLGTYTNFVNLLGLCGLTVPTAPRADGWPASVTLLAPDGHDARLATIGRTLEADPQRTLGATGWQAPRSGDVPAAVTGEACRPEEIAIAVCGAHMSGLPLNRELTDRGGRFIARATTSSRYRLYALPGTPARPGLVRVPDDSGVAIALEIWALPRMAMGDFLVGIPAPLGIGTLELAGGEAVKGFLCEQWGVADARDISTFGGWRAFTETCGDP